jgi:hypothetical protein
MKPKINEMESQLEKGLKGTDLGKNKVKET